MTADAPRKALVAGAGIGGLAAALCLAERGLEVLVLEQSAVLGEVGAGLQVSPNASRVLHALGLEAALSARAFLPQATQFRAWRSGRVIAETPLGEAATARYGAPYYHLHRGDLLRVLADAVAAHPHITVRLNARLEQLEQDPAGVTVRGEALEARGDLLVGADGIHSRVRAALWGEEQPRFTGNVAWRALVSANRLPAGAVRPMTTAWWGPGKHFVHYYVRGGELVNCVCVVEKTGWEVESWTERGSHAELKSDFGGWHRSVGALIDAADPDSLFKWALYDRKPMARWGSGRVTLLGDACHPTLPFMAQGAAMAIEDAAVLAACLAHPTPVPAGLERYETLRKPRTARIQTGSRRNAKVFHLSGLQAWLRNRAVRAAGSRSMDMLYSYNALDAASG